MATDLDQIEEDKKERKRKKACVITFVLDPNMREQVKEVVKINHFTSEAEYMRQLIRLDLRARGYFK